MGRMAGGVGSRSSNSIDIAFTFRGVRCRERIARAPTPEHLAAARAFRAAIVAAIAEGTFNYAAAFPHSPRRSLFAGPAAPAAKTVGPFLTAWIAKQKNQLADSTYRSYAKVVRLQLVPWFGDIALPKLDRAAIRARLETLGCANKTLSNIQSVLRAALGRAIEDKLIAENPLRDWTFKNKEGPKEDKIDPFTKAEQAALLAAAKGQGRNLIQFALWTGLRTSELVALDWGDIDYVQGAVRVRRARTQGAKKAGTTKTVAGNRDVKLLPEALAALAAQKAYTWLKGEEVFQNPNDDQRWAGDQPIRRSLWAFVVKRAGVRYRNPYQTRHTYASMMLSSGESDVWLAKQMGHANTAMIRRVYGRWMPDADPLAGTRADAVFGSARSV